MTPDVQMLCVVLFLVLLGRVVFGKRRR